MVHFPSENTHREAETPVVANDEPGLAYQLEDRGSYIALCVDHQSFQIGPEFEDTEEGDQERDWFKSMIHVALRGLVAKASRNASQAQDGYGAAPAAECKMSNPND